jgi:hypothetical protein
MSLAVDELKSTKCQVLTCRRVVRGDKLSVDQLSVDGLSPHRICTSSPHFINLAIHQLVVSSISSNLTFHKH